MIKNLHDIDKIFKNGLEDHREPVPSSVWEGLNNDLDKKQAAHFKEKYFRLRRLAILLVLLGVGSTGLLYFYSAGNKKQVALTQEKAGSSSITPGSNITSVSPQPLNNKTNLPPDGQPSPEKENDPVTIISAKENNPGVNPNSETGTTGNEKSNTAQFQQMGYGTSSRQRQLSSNNAAAKQQVSATTHRLSAEVYSRKKRGPKELQTGKTQDGNLFSSPVEIDKDAGLVQATAPNKGLALHTNENKKITHSGSNAIGATYLDIPKPFVSSVPAIDLSALFFATPNHNLKLTDSISKNVQEQIAKQRAVKNTLSIHRFSLGLFISPNHSFTRLENDGRLSGPGRDKNEALHSERQGTSYSAGLLLNYGLSRHIELQSGLVFSSAKTEIAPKTIYARQDNSGHARYELNCSSGYAYYTPKTGTQPSVGDSIRIVGSSSSISYMGVPLTIGYVLKAGKFLIKPAAGISLNFLTSSNSATSFSISPANQKENTTINGLKTAYLDGSLGLGIEYMLSRKMSAGLRPQLRWALTSINKNTPVKAYQNYTGLEAGLRISF